jgi:hypothetical protein
LCQMGPHCGLAVILGLLQLPARNCKRHFDVG